MNYDHEILALSDEDAERLLPRETWAVSAGIADLRNDSGIIERH